MSWYPRLSKSIVKVVSNETELLETIVDKWVEEKPLFNIIVRTSRRPNYFHDCVKSIKKQTHKNYNIIVGFDDPESLKYIQGHPCTAIELNKITAPQSIKPEGEDYGIWFPFNNYFNQLLPYAQKGYIIYLDDDDFFESSSALSELSEIIRSESADAIFWRVKFPKRIVPSDESWGKKIPICRDISTIGYCHSSKIIPTWEPWKRGDYRVAKFIYETAKKTIWHNQILTGLQRAKQDGYGLRDDKNRINITTQPPITVIITAFNAAAHLERCIDSVVNQKIQGNSLSVLVGVDGCTETFKEAKKLTRKYKETVKFYYSKENCGTYKIKNALLKKIIDRDSLVFFLDSDDIIPSCFLKHYTNKAIESKADITQVLGINIEEGQIRKCLSSRSNGVNSTHANLRESISKGAPSSALENALSLVINHGTLVDCGIYLSILRSQTLNERFNSAKNELKPTSRYPHGSFFCRYTALEDLNFFNEFRVAQDTDLLNRAKKIGIKIFRPNRADTFSFLVRSVSSSSLTQGNELGINSDARKKIVSINEERIKDGNLIGSGEMATISIIL